MVVCTHIYLKANIYTSTEYSNSSVGYCTDQLAFQSGVGATYCDRLACMKARTSNPPPEIERAPDERLKQTQKQCRMCTLLLTHKYYILSIHRTEFYLVRFHTYHFYKDVII
jgi:hypothetical protein